MPNALSFPSLTSPLLDRSLPEPGPVGAAGSDGADGSDGVTTLGANTSIAIGDTIASAATEIVFASTVALSAGVLTAGRLLHVEVHGVVGWTGTPTLTFRVYVGAAEMVVRAHTFGTYAADEPFCLQCTMNVFSAGGSGQVAAAGLLLIEGAAYAVSNGSLETVNTTGALTVSASAEWSASDAANTVTLRQICVW